MPDFKSEIRRSIADANVSPADEEQIVEELSQHLEERFEQALSHGASEEQAKQLALDELAQPDSLSAELRSTKLPLRRPPLAIGAQWKGSRFAGFFDDLRFGLRMLAKQPAFARSSFDRRSLFRPEAQSLAGC